MNVTSGWGEWTLGDCSLTCGSGSLDKTRACLDYNDDPVGNDQCEGGESAALDTESCETQDCPSKSIFKLTMVNVPLGLLSSLV